MDMSLVDVTEVNDHVTLADEAVIIGGHGTEAISADGLAAKLGTIGYDIVTGISHRVPRIAVATETE